MGIQQAIVQVLEAAPSKRAMRITALAALTLAFVLVARAAHAQGGTPLSGATGIAAGDRHACALLATGGVKCWGNNDFGKLGDGTTTASSYAVDVQGVANAVDFAAGQEYGCVVTDTGSVKCWGLEPQFNAGSGSASEVRGLYEVSGLGGMTALKVAAGTLHACAIVDTATDTGAVRCWGNNEYGQLGNGTVSSSEILPVPALGITGATAIAAGDAHTCAIVAGVV
jgi:alpha-tubulin suppressor-like RCC1 family protein